MGQRAFRTNHRGWVDTLHRVMKPTSRNLIGLGIQREVSCRKDVELCAGHVLTVARRFAEIERDESSVDLSAAEMSAGLLSRHDSLLEWRIIGRVQID